MSISTIAIASALIAGSLFSVSAHAEIAETCSPSLFNAGNIVPGEKHAVQMPVISEAAATDIIADMEKRSLLEMGTQAPCSATSESCFGTDGNTLYRVAKIQTPVPGLITSRGQILKGIAASNPQAPNPFAIYEITTCEWGFPGLGNNCVKACTLIVKPLPGQEEAAAPSPQPKPQTFSF